MKIREFNKLLNIITDKKGSIKRVNESKIPLLTDDQRSNMVNFIVSKRAPVLYSLIPEGFDFQWLACMAYMNITTNKAGYKFTHTSEHRII